MTKESSGMNIVDLINKRPKIGVGIVIGLILLTMAILFVFVYSVGDKGGYMRAAWGNKEVVLSTGEKVKVVDAIAKDYEDGESLSKRIEDITERIKKMEIAIREIGGSVKRVERNDYSQIVHEIIKQDTKILSVPDDVKEIDVRKAVDDFPLLPPDWVSESLGIRCNRLKVWLEENQSRNSK